MSCVGIGSSQPIRNYGPWQVNIPDVWSQKVCFKFLEDVQRNSKDVFKYLKMYFVLFCHIVLIYVDIFCQASTAQAPQLVVFAAAAGPGCRCCAPLAMRSLNANHEVLAPAVGYCSLLKHHVVMVMVMVI